MSALPLLVVQGTPFCNIDCRYCYLPERLDTHRMSIETFEYVIREIVAAGIFASGFEVLWHAGEPLVLPIDFYAACLEVTSRYDSPTYPIRHVVQTNATLITDAWCAFFRQGGFEIGVSVDGPAWLNDLNRIDRQGRGTFDKVARGMQRLREATIPFGIVCVLTRASLNRADELFTFFQSSGAETISFNVEELEGAHQTSSLAAPEIVEEFKAFVRRLLALNDACEEPLTFKRLTYSLAAKPEPVKNALVTPWSIITVDYAGNLSTFSPELIGTAAPQYENFVFGNLMKQPLAEIQASAAFRAVHADVERGVERCRHECEYFAWCGGGQPSNKWAEHRRLDTTETLECRLMKKAVIDVNLERLEDNLAAIAQSS